jgi:hypothetical protein
MKAKTIRLEISKKVNDWISTIDDIKLASDLTKDVVVTGGCITSMFQQEDVNDYDIYLRSPKTAFNLAKYYANKIIEDSTNTLSKDDIKLLCETNAEENLLLESSDLIPTGLQRTQIYIKSSGVYNRRDYDKEPAKEKYSVEFLSSNAITLSNKIQIILRFTGTPDEIHSNYDFIHATNYWTKEEGLVTNTRALECIMARELIYRGSKYPLSSIFRTRKFVQRGWSCHVGNYLKMAMQLNDMDLTDINVLREQLTGVDSLYLQNLVDKLECGGSDLTSSYVCEVIDRMMSENE